MTDLITLEEYKVFEAKTTSTDDTKLEQLITSVSGLIKTYCNTSFIDYTDTDKTEYITVSTSTNKLFLKETPIISVTSIQEREALGSTYSDFTDLYFIDESIDALVLETGFWGKGSRKYKVQYKAGYAQVPDEIKMVAANLVTYYHKEQYKTASQSVAGSSLLVPTDNNKVPFPGHIKRVLDQYRVML